MSKAHAAFRVPHAVASNLRAVASAALGLSILATAQFAGASPVAMSVVSQEAAAPVAAGGPFEPIDSTASKSQPDPQFRAMFQSWKRLDQSRQGVISIPSLRPVDSVAFSSGFGVRSDPFRSSAAMHAGVDMPGKIGTNVYATADGVVGRSEWAGGYGNLVEIDHGRGIQTRYGHLSASLVHAGQYVKRGELIARMGSTGRSTGSHLHYEVRLDGHAVNPMPFLQSATYLAAIPARTYASARVVPAGAVPARVTFAISPNEARTVLAMGGPAQ